MNEIFLKNLIMLMENNSKYKIDLDLRLNIKDLK